MTISPPPIDTVCPLMDTIVPQLRFSPSSRGLTIQKLMPTFSVMGARALGTRALGSGLTLAGSPGSLFRVHAFNAALVHTCLLGSHSGCSPSLSQFITIPKTACLSAGLSLGIVLSPMWSFHAATLVFSTLRSAYTGLTTADT